MQPVALTSQGVATIRQKMPFFFPLFFSRQSQQWFKWKEIIKNYLFTDSSPSPECLKSPFSDQNDYIIQRERNTVHWVTMATPPGKLCAPPTPPA